MPNERQSAIAKLKKYDDLFERILNMVEGQQRLQGAKAEKAGDLLCELKDGLDAECRAMSRSDAKLNKWEKAYVYPGLSEAKADLTVKRGSPPGQAWYSNLYSSRHSVSHYLNGLEKAKD